MTIQQFAHRHTSQRCFLLGGGPSLAVQDLSPLRGEITMSCNRGYLLFDRIGAPTTYWALEDTLDASQYSAEVARMTGPIKFVTDDLVGSHAWGDVVSTPFVRGPVDYPKFSVVPPFQWGGTVMYLMIQLAAFMGCSPIYLLGNDFRWSSEGQLRNHDGLWLTEADHDHFDPQYWPKGFKSFPPNSLVMRRAFLAANRAISGRIINLTPYSLLDVFECLDYDAVLRGDAETRPRMEQHAEEIQALAAFVGQPRHVLEIGVRAGGTSALWHDISSGLVIGVDKTPNPAMAVRFPRFRNIVGDSHELETVLEVKRLLAGDLVDVLFIDGDHSLRGTAKDYENYKQFVRPGGTIAFHDINAAPEHFEVWEEGGSPRFWRELSGLPKREFTIHASWGGIGVVPA